MHVFEVGKHVSGICHVLVYVVEIGKQQFAPAVKMVESLVYAGAFYKAFMQVAYKFYAVACLKRRVASEHFTYGKVCRRPQRAACRPCQNIAKEERRALVGKHNGNARQAVTVFLYYVFCNVIKKCLHF